jgi:hypothetical protein
MNLIMHKLNRVRLPVRSQEFVSPYLSPECPRIDLFIEISPPWKGFPRTWKKELNVQVLTTLYEEE